MHPPVEDRSKPEVVQPALNLGNWLAFAVACQWLSDLDYVFGEGGGSDTLHFYMTDDRGGLQLKATTKEQLDRVAESFGEEHLQGRPDPIVPLREIRAEKFIADKGYDAIVLCRSPG